MAPLLQSAPDTAVSPSPLRAPLAWLAGLLRPAYEKQVDGTGLAVFRAAFCVVLLAEVSQLLRYYPLIYDVVPGVQAYPFGFRAALLVWLGVLTMLALGLWTRPAAALNYVLCLTLLPVFNKYTYDIDYTFLFLSLLLVFLPVGRVWSLDRYLRNRSGRARYPRTVSQLSYFAPVVLGLGYAYLSSALFKFGSPMWLRGLGLWLPASLPHNVLGNYSWLLNQRWLVTGLSYLTLGFELVFVFVATRKDVRPWLLLIGVGLHLGIGLIFPIPLFAAGYCALYTLLVPHAWWRRLFRLATPGPAVSAPDELKPREQPALPPWQRRDFRLRAIAVGVAVITLLQVVANYDSVLFLYARQKTGIDRTRLGRLLYQLYYRCTIASSQTIGITTHALFMDFHFTGYNHELAVSYVRPDGRAELLPISTPEGFPGAYCRGGRWCYWAAIAVGPQVNQSRLTQGLRDWTAYWATEHGVSLSGARFHVTVRKIAVPTTWEPDFLSRQLAQPWLDGGTVEWRHRRFTTNLREIELL